MTQLEHSFIFDLHWWHPKEDSDFWNDSIKGLSTHDGTTDSGTPIPCSCGPHSLRSMRLFYDWAKPQKMMEIGFNIGHSASNWLKLGVPKLVSVDIRKSSEVLASAAALQKRHGAEKFRLVIGDGGAVRLPDRFDSAFIDGDHTFEGICRDIETVRAHGVKRILFDDLCVHHTETIGAIQKTGLTVVFLSGNQIACEDADRSQFVRPA